MIPGGPRLPRMVDQTHDAGWSCRDCYYKAAAASELEAYEAALSHVTETGHTVAVTGVLQYRITIRDHEIGDMDPVDAAALADGRPERVQAHVRGYVLGLVTAAFVLGLVVMLA
jgi:hypothetical protein